MGAREWIYVAIAVLAVYLVFQLIRALQVKEPGATVDTVDDEDELVDTEDEDDASQMPGMTEAPPSTVAGETSPRPSGPVDALPAEDSFGLALEVRQLRRDVSHLREELDAQRNEVAEMRQTLAAQTQQIEATRAAQRVSPIYGEALALAQRGMAAEVIAERCSISVAEAELVQSLAQDSSASGEVS